MEPGGTGNREAGEREEREGTGGEGRPARNGREWPGNLREREAAGKEWGGEGRDRKPRTRRGITSILGESLMISNLSNLLRITLPESPVQTCRKFLPPKPLQIRDLRRRFFGVQLPETEGTTPGGSLGGGLACLQRHRGYPSLSQKSPLRTLFHAFSPNPSSPSPSVPTSIPSPSLRSQSLPSSSPRRSRPTLPRLRSPAVAVVPAVSPGLPGPSCLPHLIIPWATMPPWLCLARDGHPWSTGIPADPANRSTLPQDGLLLPARCPE